MLLVMGESVVGGLDDELTTSGSRRQLPAACVVSLSE